MNNDPIVEEVRRAREEILRECGGREGYLKMLMAMQAREPDRYVSREPKSDHEQSVKR